MTNSIFCWARLLNYGAWPAFKYYSKRYGFTEGSYVLGISSKG